MSHRFVKKLLTGSGTVLMRAVLLMGDASLPSVSFVMPVFNRPSFLRASVESIFGGNFRAGDELVIVDDGSTDSTPAVVAELAGEHPEIRSIRHRFNKGSAAAGRNTGIDAAANEWIFCLDSDNLLVAGSVEKLLKFALEQGADVAAFGGIEYFKSDPADVEYSQQFKEGQLTLADALASHVWPGPSGNYLFTRSSWVKAGRQNEFVGGGIDSWAFGIRQLAAGLKFVTLPGLVYKHRVGHDSAYIKDEKEGFTASKALQALMPIFPLLEEESVEYLYTAQGRREWFSKLVERPLRVRGQAAGVGGKQDSGKPPTLMYRIRFHLARLIAPKP